MGRLSLDISNVNDKLASLQAEFHQQLPASIAEIRQQWLKLCRSEFSHDAVSRLHVMAHGLTGSSGTFGAMAVSTVCAELEALLKKQSLKNSTLDSTLQEKIESLLNQMEAAAKAWHPTAIPFVAPVLNDHSGAQGGEIICLVEDDVLVARDITIYLEKANYQVEHFLSHKEFEDVCTDIQPDAVLMDMMFEGDELDGAQVVKELEHYLSDLPVIFISNRNDVEARLAATRAGASRYFTKPLNMDKLVKTLDGLFDRQPELYRILLIDNDTSFLEYAATVLREAGLQLEVLSEPLQCLDVLAKFKPDLTLMDIYMPSCSGLELAQVIRQDDDWAQMPIVFLSTERDLDQQLIAMNLGGDDFINKSIEPRHLIQSVMAKAKRSRWSSVVQRNLQDALRDSEYMNITLDQHAIVSIADVKGDIIYANDKFCEASEYTRTELLGQNHRLLKSGMHPTEFFEGLWQSISRGEIWHGCICNRSKSGREYWVESTIVPFLDERGKPYQYVAVRTDVTSMRANEERLNRSQEFANIGTWDWNIKTGDLYWSERIAPLFGYETGELEHTYDNFIQSVHPEDRQLVMDSVNDCVYRGAKYDIEHRVVWPSGSVRYVQERGDVVHDEHGKPAHMLGVVQDVTRRKEAEFALKESEKRLKMAQHIGKIGNWSWNVASGKIYWSDEIYRIFGYQPGEFEPNYERFMAAVHPDDVERIKQSELAAAEKGEKHSIDHRIILPDGQVRWVHEEAETIKNDAGDVTTMHGTVQDISNRIWNDQLQKGNGHILELIAKDKPLEEILTVIVDHCEKMLPGVIGSILLLDDTGCYLRHSVAPRLPDFYSEAIDGLEIGPNAGSCGAAAFTGEPVIAVNLETDPNWVAFRELTKKAGLGACWSLPILASSGRVLGTFAMYYSKPKEPDDSSLELAAELANFAAIAIEQKRALKALVDAMRDAEKANHAKSQFLSSMSHELRTPMNAIIGFAQLLKMDKEELNNIQLDNVQEIIRAGHHLLTLINEVLDLSKIESGHMELSIEPVLVSDVVEECLSLIMPLAAKRGIQVKLTCNDEELSHDEMCQQGLEVQADRTRLKQVMFNLLSNAVKYNRENGQIVIACAGTIQGYVRIAVKDTGPGIPEEKQSELFKVFNRLGAEHSEIEGTGIGLVITRNIVERMGGQIGVESEFGKGSTFWFELPDNKVAQIKAEKQSLPQYDQMLLEKPDECEYTLLYVEDNPANLRLMKQLLVQRPHVKMLSAAEPLLGLELAIEHKPDLVLLDINLPGIDGYEVLKHLRSRKETRETPVVAVSANAMPADIQKGLNAGFAQYLTKPIDVTVLLRVIDEVLYSLIKTD